MKTPPKPPPKKIDAAKALERVRYLLSLPMEPESKPPKN